MKRHTKSILEEISQSVPQSNREALIESRASHVISSALNLILGILFHYMGMKS